MPILRLVAEDISCSEPWPRVRDHFVMTLLCKLGRMAEEASELMCAHENADKSHTVPDVVKEHLDEEEQTAFAMDQIWQS